MPSARTGNAQPAGNGSARAHDVRDGERANLQRATTGSNAYNYCVTWRSRHLGRAETRLRGRRRVDAQHARPAIDSQKYVKKITGLVPLRRNPVTVPMPRQLPHALQRRSFAATLGNSFFPPKQTVLSFSTDVFLKS
jgi:hypothetical protein